MKKIKVKGLKAPLWIGMFLFKRKFIWNYVNSPFKPKRTLLFIPWRKTVLNILKIWQIIPLRNNRSALEHGGQQMGQKKWLESIYQRVTWLEFGGLSDLGWVSPGYLEAWVHCAKEQGNYSIQFLPQINNCKSCQEYSMRYSFLNPHPFPSHHGYFILI